MKHFFTGIGFAHTPLAASELKLQIYIVWILKPCQVILCSQNALGFSCWLEEKHSKDVNDHFLTMNIISPEFFLSAGCHPKSLISAGCQESTCLRNPLSSILSFQVNWWLLPFKKMTRYPCYLTFIFNPWTHEVFQFSFCALLIRQTWQHCAFIPHESNFAS